MHTRTAVITGAAGGLGRELARQLLGAGFEVIAVTRDPRSAEAVQQSLKAAAPGRTVRALHADLVDRADVGTLASRLRDVAGRVDVLINNAGAAFASYAETTDGVERAHALNHLAPFQLTHLLLADGLLAPDARVINISTDLIGRGRLDSADPDVTGVSWRDHYSQMTVYGTAKLASLLATTELAARMPVGITAYSATPGVIRSSFHTKAGGMLKLASSVGGLFAQTPEKAARTPMLIASAAKAPAPNGGFFAKGAAATPPRTAQDRALAARVYERTASILALTALPTAAGHAATFTNREAS
ncbi:SDR family NAD(P)-dependent oxidoreductase [Actinoplanes sp. NPDC049265]|uniref:SDR family NAD(P)-dependent oxidoreductase n=1 Tax=Actinoplanes sp. NPDC049265 TaxID=3363902 RepID=UPI003714519E